MASFHPAKSTFQLILAGVIVALAVWTVRPEPGL